MNGWGETYYWNAAKQDVKYELPTEARSGDPLISHRPALCLDTIDSSCTG